MHNRASNGRKDTRIDGLRTLGLDRRAGRRLRHALAEARRLSGPEDLDAGDGLRRLAADARLIEAAIPTEKVRGLPARRGQIRLYAIAAALLRGGEHTLAEDGLMNALRDEALSLRELWSFPTALRVAAADALGQVCSAIVRGASDCAAAESWLDHPRGLRQTPSPDFVEYALRRCVEENRTKPRALLEACLRRENLDATLMIRQAHDARAHRLLRLENLMAALRLLDGLDWQACFEALSETDAELRRDPAGVYPMMDEASRRAVLEQVEAISRATGISERTVARHAVHAARIRRKDGAGPEAGCCWWLYDDRGRAALLERMGRPRVRLQKRVPDPRGVGCVALSLMLTAAIAVCLCRWLGVGYAAIAVPAAWAASDALIGRLTPWLVRPARLLKLDFKRLPEEWRTLIVTPVLLTGPDQATNACNNLEALGCLEDDPNIACLLLADFADADVPELPGDDAIVRRVRERIAAMNRRAGREKYFYLHRPRTLLEADGRYMGRDRKRGALMDLNRVLLGGDADFGASGAACDALRGQYACVVTLDADTRMLPGTVHRLVGTLAHPLNRRYAVIQPRMEVAPSAITNRFALLFSGAGGLDTYPAHTSNAWMDLTGAGIYGGKGVYRVESFQRAVEGRLPQGRVLSHDLIEGALAGTGFAGDIALFDGCPATLTGWMKRQHRWARGDWQLLPLMLSPKYPLSVADRFRMLDNLMRGLRAPALLLLLMASAWTGSAAGAAAGLLLVFQGALLHPTESENQLRGLVELAGLPLTAHRMADAALRALWRVFLSGKHLMDWVPSAEADRDCVAADHSGKIAALLALPGILVPDGLPLALGLFMLFWVGADWIRDMERTPVDDAPALDPIQRRMLHELARDTWRFFSDSVTPDGPALPPDNVQVDPPAGAARRTSPTNVGLYLLSCVSARALGLIDRRECAGRVARALDALDKAEKWRGHLFNWIDIDTLSPLQPRYVSAVDSGNLAACALACAGLIGDDALSARLRSLAGAMDFAALYDARRDLFMIGVDVDNDQPSASHYDLLASEARILSYVALMLNQAPLRHWPRLGRGCVPAGNGAALVSWSGTMFEYIILCYNLKTPPFLAG